MVVFERINIRVNHLEELTRSVVSDRFLKFEPKLDARVLSIVYEFERGSCKVKVGEIIVKTNNLMPIVASYSIKNS